MDHRAKPCGWPPEPLRGVKYSARPRETHPVPGETVPSRHRKAFENFAGRTVLYT